MNWGLPASLEIAGEQYEIRTDFRDILTVIAALNDPDLPDAAKAIVCIRIIYKDWQKLPQGRTQEALDKAMDFVSCGIKEDRDKPSPVMMNWEQDYSIVIPAINKVYGNGDVRALPYLHWWTFIGYYMEIGESLFSQVLSIRSKKIHGKKLEKWEREFEKENRSLIRLKKPMSEQQKQEEAQMRQALEALI